MKNKDIIYVVYPDSLKAVSMNNLAMSELLLNELILSKNTNLVFHVNNKLMLVECNDSRVKKILDVLLKCGKLLVVRDQVSDMLHKGSREKSMLGRLKFLVDGDQVEFTVREIESGVDFSWQIRLVS